MRSIQPIAVVLVSVLACACGDHHGAEHRHDQEAGAHAPAGESDELRLNAGAKWEMDDHTRSMFVAMVERTEAQRADNSPPRELGTALQSDVDALIQGCIMTGEAHAELHKFLMAYMPAVDKLASEGGDEAVREVENLLDLYPRFFE